MTPDFIEKNDRQRHDDLAVTINDAAIWKKCHCEKSKNIWFKKKYLIFFQEVAQINIWQWFSIIVQ